MLGRLAARRHRAQPDNFLTFAPDELASNRLQDILEVTGRDWQVEIGERDEQLDRRGRAIEVLCEHMCQGLLEGYLLTGRHGCSPATRRSSTSSTPCSTSTPSG